MFIRGLIGSPGGMTDALFHITGLEEGVGIQYRLSSLSTNPVQDWTRRSGGDQCAIRISIHESRWESLRHVLNDVWRDVTKSRSRPPSGALPGVIVLAAPCDGRTGADDASSAALCGPNPMQRTLHCFSSFVERDFMLNCIPIHLFTELSQGSDQYGLCSMFHICREKI